MMRPMTEAGTISVTARVAHGTKEQLQELKPLFAAERRRAREMQGEERWSTAGLQGRDAAARRAEWAEHRALLRRRGELVMVCRNLTCAVVTRDAESRYQMSVTLPVS
jgi:hypothetical protein